MLPGALPAGPYTMVITGFQSAGDAKLHADVLYRAMGAADRVIVSADSNIEKNSDAGLTAGSISATLQGPAVAARCGDLLVLRVKLLSGSSGYVELSTSLMIP